MHANNETGTVQPIAALSRITHQAGALFHTDAAQTAGKIPLDVADLDVDLLTLVGHKMYAPKGIAALYVRAGIQLERRLAELPAGVDVVAYCRGAYCVLAYDAVRLLTSHGWSARRLREGMLEWRLAGMPVQSGAA
jgi:rhodanese-related sulfurtransferase